MQNIGLEMRKCVAGGQKIGLQTPNSTFRPGKWAHIRRGAGGFSTKEAARSEKARGTRSQLDLSPGKAGAHSTKGRRLFPQKRRRARRKRGRTLREGAKKAPHSTKECDARVGFAEIAGVLRENLAIPYLIGEFGADVFAVQASDVGDRFVLGADGFASTGVGAVTKSEFVHLGHHEFRTTCGFYATLGEEGELRNLGRNEEHGATVLTSGHASAATDARGAVHGLIGVGFGDEDGVGVLCLSGADGGVTAGGLDFVEGGAIDHAVLDDGEGSGAPRFYGDDVAIVETTHVELAGGGALCGFAVGRTVDVEGAHAADAFSAVVVEDEGLFSVVNEFLVEDIEHFEEGGVVGNVLHFALFEMSGVLGPVLLPIFYCERYILSHFRVRELG